MCYLPKVKMSLEKHTTNIKKAVLDSIFKDVLDIVELHYKYNIAVSIASLCSS